MQLEGEAENQKAVVSLKEDTPGMQNLKCDVLIKSIGYKSLEMPGVPFDKKRNVIPSQFGCVEDPETKQLVPGLYCCGWVKRGPVGIIDATLRDAMDTFRVVKHHIDDERLSSSQMSRSEVLDKFFGGDKNDRIVTMDKWYKI